MEYVFLSRFTLLKTVWEIKSAFLFYMNSEDRSDKTEKFLGEEFIMMRSETNRPLGIIENYYKIEELLLPCERKDGRVFFS